VTPKSDRVLPPPTAAGPLLNWLLDALRPMSRTRVKQLLRNGQVCVNGVPVTRHDHAVHPGDRVTIAREGQVAASRDRDRIVIVHEDDAVIAIDKPAGLLTVATEAEKTDTVFVRLRDHLAARRAGRPFVVHRLDRDTSGLLLFARTPEARDLLQQTWDAVTKTYLAVVEGVPRQAEGVVDNHLTEGRNLRVRTTPPGGEAKRAVSRYRVLATKPPHSLVEVVIETGRKHQIRVHLAGLGCPVVGDRDYGARTNPARRLGLHAWRLAFDHPVTGERVELEAPFPEVLRRVVPCPF
jgi:23S rRNA pseudouridine1911/1915/1917 synthase